MRSVAYIWAVLAVLLAHVGADEPTLARLSFWVPPERMAEFEATYEEQVVPILQQHGLVESSQRGRATVDSVFSRLFAVETPTALTIKRQELHKDPAWQDVLRSLGTAFEARGEEGFIRNRFALYKAPAEGTTVLAGPGFRQGLWQNFSAQDGLPSYGVDNILQDREGHLWFLGGGVTRYDGTHFTTFTTFTTKEDLAGNRVGAMLEDRQGHLWFGTQEGGVIRYDGTHFTAFTTEDGLAHNSVSSIVKDRQGTLWFGTVGGVSRYDGTQFSTFTVEDGLAHNNVLSIAEDRQGNLWFGMWFGTGHWSDEGGGVSRFDGNQFTTFTTQDGLAHNRVEAIVEDRQGNLWFSCIGQIEGTWTGGVSRYDGQEFLTFTTEDGLAGILVRSIAEDRQGNLWFGTHDGLSRYDGTQFVTFTTQDGLAHNYVDSIVEDRAGYLWVGTRGGMSRYDKVQFAHFTTEDGLASNRVSSIVEDRQGHLWFGTNKGVSRYDGTQFVTFTTEDGLAHNRVQSIVEDRQGNLWFGTWGGVSRYDGHEFVTFTVEDGLAANLVWSIEEDRQGNLWFGTYTGGVSRYDGKHFTTFTTDNTQGGLADNAVYRMLEDRQGTLWFIGGGGGVVSRYDGKHFTPLDGLPGKHARSILEDQQGHLWFATGNAGGVSRYDGQEFVTFTTEDGLVEPWIETLLEDRQGNLWFGSKTGGVSRFDGQVFQTLSRQDGLINNAVTGILQDRHGAVWITTSGGVTRYRPQHTLPPTIRLIDVIADRRYGSVEELRLPSSQAFVTFEFQGRSMTTRPDGMVYVYRLQGHDDEWRTTRTTQVEYTDLPTGDYVFQVKAVDRDFNYSEPAEVRVSIHPPYGVIGLAGGLGLALVLAVATSGYAIRKRRDLRRSERALMRELEEELQTAHDMQMGLMPQEQPRISGFNIAGRCLPANHVGGDFFQYFDRTHNRLAISMADVTGHAMEAAIPVVMFSGILDTQMETGGPLQDLFAKLNRSMHRNLDRRNFVCFAMGEIDPATRSFRLSNGGCPFPYHFQAANGDIVELQVEAYPLGVRPDTVYQVVEVQLESGDYIVFCSDGIAEARNAAGELFGFGRTAETVRQGCVEELSATALIDRLIGEVQAFSGDNPQEDDQTIVVVGVES